MDHLPKLSQLCIRHADAEEPAIVLHHVDAGAPVRRIDHDVHRAVARKDITQRAEADVGVAQMVKDAGAHDLVECLAKLRNALDRKPVEAQIPYPVLPLKIARVPQACLADIDRGDARLGLHQRMPSGLRCSAASDEDRSIRARLLQGP